LNDQQALETAATKARVTVSAPTQMHGAEAEAVTDAGAGAGAMDEAKTATTATETAGAGQGKAAAVVAMPSLDGGDGKGGSR
jgi:hypothetical protein